MIIKCLNYKSNLIFINYKNHIARLSTEKIRQSALVYVDSGQLLLDHDGEIDCVDAGQYVFLRRNNNLRMNAIPDSKTNNYQVYSLEFPMSFLREFNLEYPCKQKPSEHTNEYPKSYKKISSSAELQHLFASVSDYLIKGYKPHDEILQLKIKEGILALLLTDPLMSQWLFDCTNPWKISLPDYMEEHYCYDITLEEHALNTGRSLAAFKRDFKNMSKLSPGRWITDRRIREAYRLISEESQKPSQIYLELGFKSLSHFSTAFKKKFGLSPKYK